MQHNWRGGCFCASMWGKCPLLQALVSWPDTILVWVKVWQAGFEANYPTSTTLHALRLLPRCSETRLLGWFFLACFLDGIQGLSCKTQSDSSHAHLCECLSLLQWAAEEKQKLSGPCRKREKLVLAESVCDNLSAVELESRVPAGVIC